MRAAALIVLCCCGRVVAGGPDASPDAAVDAASACAKPITLAQGWHAHLAVDATDVYSLDGEMGTILERVPKDGGATTTLATRVSSFALDADHVYYALTMADDGSTAGEVHALAKSATNDVVLASGAALHDLTTDASYVYYADSAGISRVPKAGGATEPVTAGAWAGIVGVDDASVYYTIAGAGSTDVRYAPKSGGASTSLITLTGYVAEASALDTEGLYFVASTGVLKVAKSSGAVSTLAGGPDFDGNQLAVSGGFVYAIRHSVTGSSAEVLAVPTSAGAASDTCASGAMEIDGVAVDDSTIYFGLIYEASGWLASAPR